MTEHKGTGRRQVALCFFLLAAGTMAASTYSIIAVPLADEFQTSRMVLMLAMTAMEGASAVMSPFAGNLMDRVSLRKLMLMGGALLSGTHLVLSYVTSFNQVLLIYALLMAPAGLLLGPISTSVLLSRWFVERRGRALGIAIAGISMGAVVFPPLIQALLDSFHWREAFRLLALILLCFTIPAALLIVNRPPERRGHHEGETGGYATDTVPLSTAMIPSVRAILRNPTFWLVVLMVGVVSSGIKGMVTNLAPLATDEGISPSIAAMLISAYATCGVLAKLSFAWVADRIHPRGIMFAMVSGFSVGMACLTQAHYGFWPIAIGVCIVGMSGSAMVALQSMLIAWIFGPRVVGRVMGVMGSVLLLTSLATPPAFGLIFDLTGSYSAIFMIFVGLSVLALAAIPHIRLAARDEMPKIEAITT